MNNSFLNDLDRILHPDYQPSDSDIVRARLRTTGVQEYHFTLDKGIHRMLARYLYLDAHSHFHSLQEAMVQPIGLFMTLQVRNLPLHVDRIVIVDTSQFIARR